LPGNKNNNFLANKKRERFLLKKKEPTAKPINATEPKAYLYAYMSKRHSKPEYVMTSHLLPNHAVTYISELVAEGFTYIGKGCATKKKDAQTRACWDFFDYLVESGKLTEQGLPKREEMYAAENNKIPKTYKPQKYDPTQAPNDRKIEYFDDEAIEEPPTKKKKKAAKKAQNAEMAQAATMKHKVAKKSSDEEAAMETAQPASGENGAKVEEATASGAGETKTITVEMNEAKSEEPAAEVSETKPVVKAANKKTKPTKPVSAAVPEKKMNALLLREEEQRIQMRNEQGTKMPRRPRNKQPFSKYFKKDRQSGKFSAQIRGKGDKMAMRRHKEVYPSDDELRKLQKLVVTVEQMLKKVAEMIEKEKIDSAENNNSDDKSLKALRCVLRVGALAKGLLLNGENKCDLILICKEKPSSELIEKVFNMISELVESEENCSVEKEDKSLVFSANVDERVYSAVVHFTSPLVQPETADDSDEFDASCLKLNQKIRQIKWWQARAGIMQTCVIITRLMKDFRKRTPVWECMNEWTMEVVVQHLIENAIDSLDGFVLTPSTALTTVFQALSSGLLLSSDVIVDPTVRGDVNIFGYLTDQQKEDMTRSAQHAVRQMSFNKLQQVLGLEELKQ